MDKYVVKLYARAYEDLDSTETKERSAYRHSTLYAKELLKLNIENEKDSPKNGLSFCYVKYSLSKKMGL